MATAAKKDEPGEEQNFADELKPGTELLHGQYKIESFLNSGGFGITYLARDSLDRKVVIKECFPGSFCRRSNTTVGARSRAHQAEFKSVVKLFVQEAWSLSKLRHPNIVGVHQVFEDNDTAYMALDFVEGFDLLQTLEEGGERLPPKKLMDILEKILGAVGFIHDQNMLHRDISPDNILLDKNTGNPVLIDFGAAREEATKASRVLSALRVVKDGYSPQEFYINGSAQSPSSDLYALGATFYHLTSGDTPPNSQARLAAVAATEPDPYVPLGDVVTGYDPDFTAAIDKALQIFPKDRIQSASEWLEMINPDMRKKAALDRAEADGGIDTAVKEIVSTTAPAAAAPAVQAPAAAPQLQAVPSEPRTDDGGSNRSKIAILLASAAVVAIVAGIAVTQSGLFSSEEVVTDGEVDTPAVVAEAEATTEAEVEVAEPVSEETAEPDVVVDTVVEESVLPVQRPVDEEAPAVVEAETPAAEAEENVVATAETPAQEEVESPEAVDPVEPVVDAEPEVAEAEVKPAPLEPGPSVVSQLEPVLGSSRDVDTADIAFAETDDQAIVPEQPNALSNVTNEVPADVDVVPPVVTPITESVELSSVMSAWSVALPFTAASDSDLIVRSVSTDLAPDWLEEGQKIVEINGRSVASTDDIGAVIRATVDPGDAKEIDVVFGLLNDGESEITRRSATLPRVEEIALLNGIQFQKRATETGFVTEVVSVPAGTENELQVGDIVIAYMPTAEKIDVDVSLDDVLTREVENNVEQFNFAVARDNSMWVASFQYRGQE